MKQTVINNIKFSRPTLLELIRDTASFHGVAWAARYYAKRGVNMSTVRFALFGKH